MSQFSGFPKETVTFLSDLARNNKKSWFDAHRNDYERYLVGVEHACAHVLAGLGKSQGEVTYGTEMGGNVTRRDHDIDDFDLVERIGEKQSSS